MVSIRRVGALAIVLTLLFGACDDPDPVAEPDTTPSGTATAATSSPIPTPTPEGSPTPSPTVRPEEGGVLRVAIPPPITLDPMRAQDPGSVLVVRQMFEGLVRWDPVAQEVVPAAARSWDVEDEGRRFVFHLRPDMRWHDGKRVTAGDFKVAFDRIAMRRSASDLAYTLERVEGFVQTNQLGRGRHLRGVQAPDDETLVFELTQPYYDWPVVLTHPGLVPVPEQATRNLEKFLSEPVGNGSFSLSRAWTPGESIRLDAFDDAIEPPLLDGIRFEPFEDSGASWPVFDAGDLDVAEVPVGQFEYATENYGDDHVTPLAAGYYFGMNVRSDALNNRKLRKAINLAIDRSALGDGIYEGSMQPARGLIPSGFPGFSDDGCASVCEYLPDEAEELVSQLKARTREVRLEFTRGEPHDRVAGSVAEDLRDAGLSVTVRGYRFPDYIERLIQGRQEMFRYGWLAEYPSPDAFLTPLFDSASTDNHSGFRSQRVDRLLDDAHATRAEGPRLELYQQAERVVLKGLAVAPIGSFVSHWAAQPKVEGLTFDVMGGFDAAGVWLSE